MARSRAGWAVPGRGQCIGSARKRPMHCIFTEIQIFHKLNLWKHCVFTEKLENSDIFIQKYLKTLCFHREARKSNDFQPLSMARSRAGWAVPGRGQCIWFTWISVEHRVSKDFRSWRSKNTVISKRSRDSRSGIFENIVFSQRCQKIQIFSAKII